MTDPYNWKMPQIWPIAKTILHFSIIFFVVAFAATSTPPPTASALNAWNECRKYVDMGEIPANSTFLALPETWSAVVILRKDAGVIGVGDSHEKDPIRGALRTALADARQRIVKMNGDSAAIKWDQITLELELGSKPEPLIGGTYLEASREIEPALDGIAVRRGNTWAAAHPAVLQALNAAAAPDQTLLSLVMQLGLPARDLDAIPTTERVGLYTFEATRIVQPASTMMPTFVNRGSLLQPTPGPRESVQSAQTGTSEILKWFERSMIHANKSSDSQSAGEQRALQSLGLRGDYLPAEGKDDSINAAPTEQSLSAFALARCATLNANDAAMAIRARTVALEILTALHDVAEIEKDPLADPKSIAWIILAALELEVHGDHLKESPAAESLYANAKGLLIKMVAGDDKKAVILRGDPLEQSLAAATLASLDSAGKPLVERAELVKAIDQCWTGTSRSQIVGTLGWLLLADQKLGPVPENHVTIARAARAALSHVQIGVHDGADSPVKTRVPPDLIGAFSLSGFASKGATAQTARPGFALALMMTDPLLTPVGEQYRARSMQIGVVRFLRQLAYDDVSSYLARDPQRTLGAIRTAPWDSRVAVAGNAMALLCLEESAISIKTLNSLLESTK